MSMLLASSCAEHSNNRLDEATQNLIAHSDDEIKPLISVVIPTFNRQDTLGRSVHSVLGQTFRDFELIVVDDGSTDGTKAILTAMDDPRLRYVENSNRKGANAARNVGVEIAKGRFVAFLDSDDAWLPQKLERQLAAVGDFEDPWTVYYTQLIVNDGPKRLVSPLRGIGTGESAADYLLRSSGDMQTSTLLVPRMLLQTVKFDDQLSRHQDWDIVIRLQRAGARFRYLPEPLTVYFRDDRIDRISMSVDIEPSLHWLEKHGPNISIEAAAAFKAKTLAPRLAATRQRRKAFSLLANALRLRAMPTRDIAKLAASTFLPSYTHQPLKWLYARLSSRRLRQPIESTRQG